MGGCILELNDSEVRVAEGATLSLHSPGYAFVGKDKIEVGYPAMRRARLNPRQTFDRFWNRLSQDPLPNPTRGVRHFADLAFAHLATIFEDAGRPDEMVFAVPGSFSREQLALILGIAQAVPIKVTGLVDSAIAATAVAAGPGSHVHIDMQLHQTVLTHLEVGKEAVRTSVETVDGAGLRSFHDACARAIAETFIQQCRFDPLHQGETDQTLHNRLPRWLDTLNQAEEVMLEVEHGNIRHQAHLTRQRLIRAVTPIYDTIKARLPRSVTLLASDRLARLPGSSRHIARCAHLAPDAVFRGCVRHSAKIRSRGDAFYLVTRLPATGKRTLAVSREAHRAAPEVRAPTHVLAGDRAHALRHVPLFLTRTGMVTTDPTDDAPSVMLNGASAVLRTEGAILVRRGSERLDDGALVASGDTLSVDDARYTFITVVT